MDWWRADMSAKEHKIMRQDILSDVDYAAMRKELRGAAIEEKKSRRIEVGPFATFCFENYQSMWLQVQEMLRIEKGGADQIDGELDVYNPLIPQGSELIATLMLEIEDSVRRDRELRRLGHIEENVFIEIGRDRIKGIPTDYEDRTTADGKTSSVHWLRFVFSKAQVEAFRTGSDRVVLGVAHTNYGHMAVLGDTQRTALAKDFS